MLEQFASVGGPEFVDGLIFDLANAFAGEAEFIADIFERHGMFYADAEIEFDDIALAVGEGR